MKTNRIATFSQRAAFSLIAVAVLHTTAAAQTLSGRWDGTIDYDGLKIAFPFEFAGAGNDISGSFFN